MHYRMWVHSLLVVDVMNEMTLMSMSMLVWMLMTMLVWMLVWMSMVMLMLGVEEMT